MKNINFSTWLYTILAGGLFVMAGQAPDSWFEVSKVFTTIHEARLGTVLLGIIFLQFAQILKD